MTGDDKDFQSAQEIGKIFDSFMEKNVLCRFYLESAVNLIHAQEGYLYLIGDTGKLWLEDQTGVAGEKSEQIPDEVNRIAQKGQPVLQDAALYIPLIAKEAQIGMAHFKKSGADETFSEKEMTLGVNLTYRAAAALKTILLIEENVRMARLAAVGQTVSIVMHEVKNIIQLAKFSHDYLDRGMKKKNEEFLLKGIEGIKKALHDMDGFIYEMLSLTKHYKIKPTPFRAQDLLKELHQDLEDKAFHLKVKLDFQVEEPFGQVFGEEKSLYRALLNIAKNALEARDRAKQSYLKIRVHSRDDHTYDVMVEDNGCGLSDEVKAKLFQVFFSTKGEQGTGLGLMIIDRTVKAHHGQVNVESEFGKWTRFTLTLPKVLAAEED